MLEIILGGFFAQWLDGLFKNSSSQSLIGGTSWTSFQFDEQCYNVIKITELSGKPLKHFPYFDNQLTIGYGTSSIYNAKGVFLRMVKTSDTLQGIGTLIGVSGTNEQIAKSLVYNFAKRVDGYYHLAKILDSYSIRFDKNMAVALFDWSYNSGGAFTKTNNKSFANELKMANSDKRKMAVAYMRFRSDYVIKNVSAKYKSDYGRGWMCRWLFASSIIDGRNISLGTLQSVYKTKSAIRNKIFSDYGLLINIV